MHCLAESLVKTLLSQKIWLQVFNLKLNSKFR